MRVDAPVIGITCKKKSILPNKSQLYVEAIERAGGRAVFISPADAKELSASNDGFLIPGGKDLDPMLFNESVLFVIDPEDRGRTDFELSLLRETMIVDKPVLGICYGMQILNVFFRGTLYQDIFSQMPGTLKHSADRHIIDVSSNPFITEGKYEVNSCHHQAIKDIGIGLEPFAFSHDKIIEAVYRKNSRFVVGVQWHPERMDNEVSHRIFTLFIEACLAGK